jgi:hypothetical protein
MSRRSLGADEKKASRRDRLSGLCSLAAAINRTCGLEERF